MVPPELPNTTRLVVMAVWLAGRKEPSWPEFDRLIELIVREEGILIANQREVLRQRRERRK